MKKIVFILLFCVVTHVPAQKLYLYPATAVAPRGSYQTVTAIVNGVNDKTVTWTASGGKLVGTNPCVVNEPCTIGLYDTTAETDTLTATSNANGSVTAISTVTFTASPTPATTHPRLLITAAMLPGLQAKATSGNVIYQSIRTMAINDYTTDGAIWTFSTWNGTACTGGSGPTTDESQSYKELHANLFALLSMIDPSDPTYQWGCAGRDIFAYMMAAYTASPTAYDGNHWSDSSEQFALTVDWLMAGGFLDSGGSGAAGTATITSGVMNAPTLTTGGSGYPASSTIQWYASAGSSGCTGYAFGTATVSSSGVVTGLAVSANTTTGCTSAPTIVIESDIALTHAYLAATAKESIIMVCCGTHAPIGNYNSSSQFLTGSEWDYSSQRMMGNNYTQSQQLYLVADALTFNDNTTDDPPLPNTCSATRYQVCPDGTAGSLHAYWTYFTGAEMYKAWADMEDPNVAWQAYQAAYGNLPTVPSCDSTWAPLGTTMPCLGLGRGGEPSEGNFYGYSASRLKLALDAVYTAGYLDPIQYGPQMSVASSSYWDLRYITDLASLTGVIPSAGSNSGGNVVGSWGFLNTGDQHTYYKYPSNYVTESAIMDGNSYTGRTEGNSAMLWTILNTAAGGPLGTSYGCTQYCGFDSELGNDFASAVAIDLFITQPAGDPVTSLPADPRPSLPTDLYDAGNQHIAVRNNWTSSGTLFSYYAPNTAIDHEHEFDGRFDIFSNGEYITKGRVEFNDYNNQMTSAPQQNLVAYQNNPTQTGCTVANYCLEGYAAQYGGQYWHAEQGGPITLLHSELPTYVAAILDQSNAYNASAYADFPYLSSGITASRSLIYLRGSNQVVFYDRGNSGSNVWTKQLYQMTTGNPTISGNVASWPTRSGTQIAYFTSLLPSGAALTNAGLTATTYYRQPSDWEPYTSLEVNGGAPLSTQFLTVLEWGASTLTQSTTTLVQSSSGQNFDCAEVGTSMACFMRNWPATFTEVTYPASGATTHYISDLTPNTTYTISGAGAPASATTDTAGVLTFASAGTGNVTVGETSELELPPESERQPLA